MPEKKKEALMKLREALDKWEQQVTMLGNECAWTDRTLDDVPNYVDILMEIPNFEDDTDWEKTLGEYVNAVMYRIESAEYPGGPSNEAINKSDELYSKLINRLERN